MILSPLVVCMSAFGAESSPHELVQSCDMDGISAALEAGADPRDFISDFAHNSPLRFTVEEDNGWRCFEVLKLLMGVDADKAPEWASEILTNYRGSPARSSWSGAGEAVKFLIEIGGVPNGQTLNDSVSEYHESTSVLKVLLDSGIDVHAREGDRQTGQTALDEAAIRGRCEHVRLLLEAGADPNAPGSFEFVERKPSVSSYPLFNAAYAVVERLEKEAACKVENLLEAGADPNASNHAGETAIHVAASEEILELLLAAGSDANTWDSAGHSALHRASELVRPDVVRRLLQLGVDPNQNCNHGKTPLHYAGGDYTYEQALRRNKAATIDSHITEIVEALILAGVDAEELDPTRHSALHLASERGHANVVNTLLEVGLDPGRKCRHGDTALHYAASSGNAEAVKGLLEAGADPDDTRRNGATALSLARSRGVVMALVDAGADVEAASREGETPLSSSRNRQVIEALLDAGADPDVRTGEDGATMLHRTDSVEITETLLDAGADPDVRDSRGYTPLHWLATGGGEAGNRIELMLALVDAGADLNAKDGEYGDTPLTRILIAGNLKLANALLEVGADPNAVNHDGDTSLHRSSWSSQEIEFLLDAGADPRLRNNDGETPLHINARFGNELQVKALLEGGADLDAQDNDGEVPLHWAVIGDGLGVVRLLLDEGADPDADDEEGETPLHKLWLSDEDPVEIATALLDAGADPDTMNINGYTPLVRVFRFCKVRTLKLLLDRGSDPMILRGRDSLRLEKCNTDRQRGEIVAAVKKAARRRR